MAEEGPYEILPYAEIDDLKSQMRDIKKDSASSKEILDSVNRLTKIMENMLILFQNAAENMEKQDSSPLNKKVDKLLEQHETLAESILTIVAMLKESRFGKDSGDPILKENTKKRDKARPDFPTPPPIFERPMPSPPPMQQPPSFGRPFSPQAPPPSRMMQPPSFGPNRGPPRPPAPNRGLAPANPFDFPEEPPQDKKQKKSFFGITLKK